MSDLDSAAIPWRRAAVAVLALLAAPLLGALLVRGPSLAILAMGALAYVATLPWHTRWLSILFPIAFGSTLVVPFLGPRPLLWEALGAVAYPALVVTFLLRRDRGGLALRPSEAWAALLLLALVGVQLCLMVYRGFGFRALGGEAMGGRFYLQALVLLPVPLLLIAAGHSRALWTRIMIVHFAMGFTAVAAELSFRFADEAARPLLLFTELPGDALNFAFNEALVGITRLQSFGEAGLTIFALVLVALPVSAVLGRQALWAVPLLLAGALLALASGHRTQAFYLVTIPVLVAAFQGYWKGGRIAAGGVAAVVLLGLIYVLGPQAPLSVQRSLSFFPGLEVDPVAQRDAAATLRDRVEVIRIGIGQLEEYWLVGRGLQMPREILRLEGIPGLHHHQSAARGEFFNGTFGLLLNLGLPGLLAAMGFCAVVSWAGWDLVRRIARKPGNPDRFDRLCQFTVAYWLAHLVFYFVLHGSAGAFARLFVFWGGLILAFRRVVLARNEAGPPLETAAQAPAHPARRQPDGASSSPA